MQLTSTAFPAGAEIPSHFTTDGNDVSPDLSWKDAPKETKSFALIVHDPDAPRTGGFTHWVVYNISPDAGHIEEGIPANEKVAGVGIQGKNDAGKIGYIGPAPPSGVHRYFFRLFALDVVPDLKPGATHKEVSAAMKGQIGRAHV